MTSKITNRQGVLNINSPLALFGVVCLGTVGAAVFIVQPGFVQGPVVSFGLSEQQVGYVASTKVWSIALATLMLALHGRRTRARRLPVHRPCPHHGTSPN
ncbi:MAG: hypothetical protein ACK5HY_16130 [Parahaliea sp.]